MEYVFHTPIPIPWLKADVITFLITLVVMCMLVPRSRHPVAILIGSFAFVFLCAGLFEDFAVVNGWYIYGRSLVMFGDVPLSVPLIELDVLIAGLWLLEKMAVPLWSQPLIVGLFGMLQDSHSSRWRSDRSSPSAALRADAGRGSSIRRWPTSTGSRSRTSPGGC